MKVYNIYYQNIFHNKKVVTIEADSLPKAVYRFLKDYNKEIYYITSNGNEVPDSYVDKLVNESKKKIEVENANKKRKGKR